MYIVFHPRFWPDHIRQRVNSTYTYFATGLSVTSVAAFAATRATSVMRFMAGRPVAVSSTCSVFHVAQYIQSSEFTLQQTIHVCRQDAIITTCVTPPYILFHGIKLFNTTIPIHPLTFLVNIFILVSLVFLQCPFFVECFTIPTCLCSHEPHPLLLLRTRVLEPYLSMKRECT